MIYSSQGLPVRIAAYCGKHQPKWANAPLCLVRLHFSDGFTWHAFMTNLKADEGIQEIQKAVDAAPEIHLNPKDLSAFLKQAE